MIALKPPAPVVAWPTASWFAILSDANVVLATLVRFEDALRYLRKRAPLHSICADNLGRLLAVRVPSPGTLTRRVQAAAENWRELREMAREAS